MNWTLAIEHNHKILLRNVAWLFTWLKLEVGESFETMPRLKRLTVLFVLRPSEAAYRRLLFVAVLVRGVVTPLVRPRAARAERPKPKEPKEKAVDVPRPQRPLPFKLMDPRKNFDLHPDKPKYLSGPGPWVTDLWSNDPIFDRSALYDHQERLKRRRQRPMMRSAPMHCVVV